MMTRRDALTRAADQLSAHPELRPDALPDAAVLLQHLLGIDRAALRAYPEATLTREELAAYQRLIERRLRFEPIQYILGTQEFFGLTFDVTPAVLIPRPETELLVEAVLAYVKLLDAPPDLDIVDVGTGSGAIAVALAVHLPHLRITAIDLSSAALDVARRNAEANGVADRIRFVEGDLLAGFGPSAFDIVVSNPPYIPTAQAAELHPQVRDFEPELALFAGANGLFVYDKLVPQALAALRPGGLLALEMGFGQRESLAEMLLCFSNVRFLDDLNGIPRVVLANPDGRVRDCTPNGASL